ncbi:SDR family NAD(P)-dependent oxidoreductase [uncultured Mycobacterium sp.]|uniref:SDR family NAD(P)-dependent oxidoreductase n=1 Tax=uncultured Mycobacterium sp. TaxID=171292 RepID=UPI0035C9FD8C
MTLPPPSPGSVAVVTGASSGIGEQFARQLVARGYRVVVTARREGRLQKLCAELGGDEHAVAVGTDLAVPQDRDRLAQRIDELGAQVDILVNNAGLGIYTKFGAEGRDKELQMLHVDVEAVVDLMLRYLPGMVDRGRGAIINLSSVSGFQPAPYNAGYAAAKAYVLWLSEAVHAEVADSGVTVTAVCPGPVPTEFQAANDADFLVSRMPAFAQVPPERVVADALKAADRGRASVVPGAPHVRTFLGSSRFIPTPLALPVIARMYKR